MRKLDLNPAGFFPHTQKDACTWLKNCGFSLWFLEEVNNSCHQKDEEGEKNRIKDNFPTSNKAEKQKAVSGQLENE